MDKNGNIIISNPQVGIEQSPVIGNEAIIGCEIFEEPGILKIQSALEEDSSYVNTAPTEYITSVPIADVTNYNSLGTVQRTVLAENNNLYSITNASTLMASNLGYGWDVCVWNSEFTVVSYSQSGTGYIGVIRHDGFSNSSAWHPAKIGSLTGSYYIKLLMAQDGYMYFTNGNLIGRITAISYDTGTGILTVTSSSNVLDLPRNIYAVTMTELGSKLLIGTQEGNSFFVRHSFKGANIYPWDRVSSSFSLPVKINENSINAMISHRNQVYFSAGDDGRIYTTDGTNYQLVKRLPYNRAGRYNPTSYVYPNAMCINQQGHLLVGLSANYDATSTTTTGIWEIALTQGYPTHLPFFSRDENLGQTSNIRIGLVRVLDANSLSFGVQSGTTYELSKTSSTVLNSNYTAKWRTGIFMVGNRKNRKSFNTLEFLLSKPLLANQGIKIAYRKNLNDSFTTIGTYDYSTLGSVISHETKALIADAEMVQFEISLTYSSSIFGYNVNLLRIILS